MYAIMSGLESSAVKKLKQTWAVKKILPIFTRFYQFLLILLFDFLPILLISIFTNFYSFLLIHYIFTVCSSSTVSILGRTMSCDRNDRKFQKFTGNARKSRSPGVPYLGFN
jgi:hypothetical protein